jgi:hypothetical protein
LRTLIVAGAILIASVAAASAPDCTVTCDIAYHDKIRDCHVTYRPDEAGGEALRQCLANAEMDWKECVEDCRE